MMERISDGGPIQLEETHRDQLEIYLPQTKWLTLMDSHEKHTEYL